MSEPTHKRLKGILRSLGRKKEPKNMGSAQNSAHTQPSQDRVPSGLRSQPDALSRASNSQLPHNGEASATTPVGADRLPESPQALGGSSQDVIPVTQPSSTIPEESPTTLVSSRLWNKAYNNLKDKESELVDTYERILSQQIVEGNSMNVVSVHKTNHVLTHLRGCSLDHPHCSEYACGLQ